MKDVPAPEWYDDAAVRRMKPHALHQEGASLTLRDITITINLGRYIPIWEKPDPDPAKNLADLIETEFRFYFDGSIFGDVISSTSVAYTDMETKRREERLLLNVVSDIIVYVNRAGRDNPIRKTVFARAYDAAWPGGQGEDPLRKSTTDKGAK